MVRREAERKLTFQPDVQKGHTRRETAQDKEAAFLVRARARAASGQRHIAYQGRRLRGDQ